MGLSVLMGESGLLLVAERLIWMTWLETLVALIGEQFDEADEICGVVARKWAYGGRGKRLLMSLIKSLSASTMIPRGKDQQKVDIAFEVHSVLLRKFIFSSSQI
ncbi:hypothetical protein DH2020_004595 [Rehmannia glutinosa]|uniref:Uncharacterized protein n=1 Tax=Rehmannia glutinosa TaxID=99300 RepID=A0ABR0XQ24_REHGL